MTTHGQPNANGHGGHQSMTHRERMLAVLRGEKPDRIPWVPRIELWYRAHQKAGTLPAKYQGWDIRSIYRDQDAGYHCRGSNVFRTEVTGIETITRRKGNETRVEIVTPIGQVSTLRRYSREHAAQGLGGLEVEHMIKGPEDYDVVAWIYEHTKVTPTYEEYLAFEMECGDEGIPQVGNPYTPIDYLLRHLIGWDQCYYHLYDYPDRLERLLKVMVDKEWETHRICAASPALIIAHGAHFHAQMTPPPIFETYFLPYMKEVSAYYHQYGKLMQFHGDADISGLESLILETGYDIAECMVTAPMVPVTLAHLRQAWGNRIVIWGGVPSTLLCDPFSDEEFEQYMLDLFTTIAPGDAIILGVADNVVPAAKWERFERIGAMVKEYGQYPIISKPVGAVLP